jgi:hypothetical protein
MNRNAIHRRIKNIENSLYEIHNLTKNFIGSLGTAASKDEKESESLDVPTNHNVQETLDYFMNTLSCNALISLGKLLQEVKNLKEDL